MEEAKGGATRLQVIALLGAGLTLACANVVQAQTEDELSALLKRQTQEFSDAGQQGDKAVLDQYLDPSVMFTEEDGSVVTKKDILDGAAPPPKGVQEKIVVTESGADLVCTISRQGDHLTGAVNGGPPVMLEAELPDVLFTPGRPRIRKIFKRDESGRVTGYVSRREGRDVMFTKSS